MSEKRRVRRTKEAARALILEAAGRLMAAQGPDAVGLKEVAEAAGVSHGLVTHYFGTYEGVVEAVLEAQVARMREDLLGRLAAAAETGADLGPEQWLESVFAAAREQGYGRLALWALLTGRTERADFFARRVQGARRVADAIEGLLRRRGAAPPRERLELVVLMLWTATLGYAVGRDVLWGSLGKDATPQQDQAFRALLTEVTGVLLKG